MFVLNDAGEQSEKIKLSIETVHHGCWKNALYSFIFQMLTPPWTILLLQFHHLLSASSPLFLFLIPKQVMTAPSPVVTFPVPSRTTLSQAVCLRRAGSWSRVVEWAAAVGSCHHMPTETHSTSMAVRWGRLLPNRWTSLEPGTGITKTYIN